MEKSDILLTGLLKRTIQIGKLMNKNFNQLMGIEALI